MENKDDFVPNCAVAFVDGDDDIVHICAYESPPSVADLYSLFQELVDDEEFGMEEDYVMNLKVYIICIEEGENILDIDDPKPEGPVNEIWGPL